MTHKETSAPYCSLLVAKDKTTLRNPEPLTLRGASWRELRAAPRSGAGRTAVSESGLLPSDSGGERTEAWTDGIAANSPSGGLRRESYRQRPPDLPLDSVSPPDAAKPPAAPPERAGSCVGAIVAT